MFNKFKLKITDISRNNFVISKWQNKDYEIKKRF